MARSRRTPAVLFLPIRLGPFQPPKRVPAGPPRSFPRGAENQELASILLCPAATSTFSAAIQARFTLASPATCICASCNIQEGTVEGFTAAYGCNRLLYFPKFKDFAQTWGWKMFTVHEKMYP